MEEEYYLYGLSHDSWCNSDEEDEDSVESGRFGLVGEREGSGGWSTVAYFNIPNAPKRLVTFDEKWDSVENSGRTTSLTAILR